MLKILNTIVIEPLILFFELVFQYVYSHTHSAGFSIIVLSICLNIILLPLYKRVEDIQNEEKEVIKKLKPGVDKIKKAFKGNEQYMVLQTYYKQNNYKPIYALRSMISLLLEIPFFIAAYTFLSNLACLEGRSFLFIKNLGTPDSLFFGINVLPIMMTLVNIVSCIIYTKDQPKKSKIQLYLISIIFFVLLYNAPASLSFYYLLNNLFSLIKNVIFNYKAKNKLTRKEHNEIKNNKSLFICCCIFLCILTGVLIPTQVINASPEEFVNTVEYINPLIYILYSFLLSFGVFILWLNIYYELMSNKIKKIIEIAMTSISVNALINHLLFKQNLGDISSLLVYENKPSFSNLEYIINLLVVIAITAIITFVYIKNNKICKSVIIALCISMLPIIIYNSININNEYQYVIKNIPGKHRDSFTLSKKNKNVVIIMIDGAVSKFFPYMLEEKPILQEQFSGFTYYPNTVSFGHSTNVGAPGLFGGYEYIPEEMNRRDDVLLKDKHNEALKLMPVLFDSNNFDVTVFNPPYAGYKEIPDLSIYEDYPDINSYDDRVASSGINLDILNRNLFCFSIVRTAPTLSFSIFYDGGDYSKMKEKNEKINNPLFVTRFSVLSNLTNYTKIVDSNEGSFLIFQNLSVHDPIELQLPDYVYLDSIDNRNYYEENYYKKSIYDENMEFAEKKQVIHYHANIAAMLKIGEWIDYLKENEIFDNTRIIIVSDHGKRLYLDPNYLFGDDEDILYYNALLLVKDFDSDEFITDYSFMTNADVPYLAMKEVIENPINPFTQKPIVEIDKNNREFNLLDSYWNVTVNNGSRFMDGEWYSVHDNCLDVKNWKKIEDPSR